MNNGLGQDFNDNYTVPNQFTSGDTISSALVNENFSSLAEQINSLKKYVYSDDNIIGEFWSLTEAKILFKNHKNYFVSILLSGDITNYQNRKDDFGVDRAYHIQADCSDTPKIKDTYLIPRQVFRNSTYNNTTSQYDHLLMFTGNLVDSNNLLYKKSSWEDCIMHNETFSSSVTFLEMFNNDPSVTGVTNLSYQNIKIK